MRSARFPFFILAALLLALILWTAPEDRTSTEADSEREAMAALFGGGPVSRTSEPSGSESVFDSDFWERGVDNSAIITDEPQTTSDEEPEILEKASEGNPINPQTGLPYTDAQMKQFETLRKRFPGNSIIPQRMTPERQKQLEEERRRIVEIQQRITAREATAEDITVFYDFQMKGMKDRAELLEYVLEKMGDSMDENMAEKYRTVLEGNRKQIQNLEEQKQKALQNLAN